MPDGSGKRRAAARALVLATGAVLALAPTASAATRFATTAGDASNTACPDDDPCDIQTAVEGASSGDLVMVAAGTYNLGADILEALTNVNVRGSTAGSRPVIRASSATTVQQVSGFMTLDNLRVENTKTDGIAILSRNSRIRQVDVNSTGTGCLIKGDTELSDSICVGAGGWPAVEIEPSGATGIAPELTNVTAVAHSGAGNPGLSARKDPMLGDISVVVRNSIIKGSLNDAGAEDVVAINNAGGGAVQVILHRSNFSSRFASASPGGTAAISAPNANGNQSAEPHFVNPLGANFHHLASSPTVDAGDDLFSTSTLDIDNDTREQGEAIDIGADELDVVPTITVSEGPAEGSAISDTTPTFSWSADEDDVDFTCGWGQAALSVIVVPCTTTRTTAPLADDDWKFVIIATDVAGNSPSVTRTFTVDTAAPETTIDSAPGSPTTDPTPSFTFSSNEADATFECRVDGAPFGPCSGVGTHTPPPLADGEHSFGVRAIDRAGNVDQTPAVANLTIESGGADGGDGNGDGSGAEDDTTAPALRILGNKLVLNRKGVAKAKLSCPADEASGPCEIAKLVVKTRGKVRVGGKKRKLTLAKAKNIEVAAGKTKKVKLKFSKKNRRVVGKVKAARKVVLVAKVADQAGNRRKVTRKAKLVVGR